MKSADNIKEMFINSKVTVGGEVDNKILNEAMSVLPPDIKQTSKSRWSLIMHSKITKYSGIAAALLLIVSLTIVNNTTSKAWAIGQTIDAFKEIKTVELNCYAEGFGNFKAFIKRERDDWTSFQCLAEKEGDNHFGLLRDNMYYDYALGNRNIFQFDLSEHGINGSPGEKLYSEALRVAPIILPYAKTLLQTFKMLASEWEETYKTDEQTGRESVFVTCTYEPLSMSFKAVFDIETKLVVRAKVWNNPSYEGNPSHEFKEISYNVEVSDDRFDFEKRFGFPIIPYEQWKPASDLFDKAHQLREEKPEEAIKTYWDIYKKYPNHFQTSHALNNIGVIYYDQKNYSKALEYFQIVVDDYPYPVWRVSDAYIYMGYCYKDMIDAAKAIEVLENGLKIIKSWHSEGSNHKFVNELEATITELKESL